MYFVVVLVLCGGVFVGFAVAAALLGIMKFRKRDYKRDELEFSLSRHSATAWEHPLRAASSISDKKNRDGGDRNIDIAPTSNAGAAVSENPKFVCVHVGLGG